MRTKEVIISVLLSLACLITRAYEQDSNGINNDPDAFYTHSMQRFIRASDADLSLEVERMQKIARLVTGIYIQITLLDGKTSPDEVVSGLLKLGNVSFSRIVSTDAKQLQSALTTLQKLPNAMEGDGSSRKAEGKIEFMDKMRQQFEGLDTTTWQGKREFSADMETVKANGVNMTVPMELYGSVKAWNSMLYSINKFKFDASNSLEVGKAKAYIDDLKKFSNEISYLLDQLITNKTKTWTFPKIKNAVDALQPLKTVMNAVIAADAKQKELQIGSGDASNLKGYSATLQTLSKTTATVTSVLPNLRLVNRIVQPEEYLHGYAGFQNASGDILNIFSDLEDSWMKEIVDADGMADSLKPLKSLAPAFERVEKAISTSIVDEKKHKILRYFELLYNLTGPSYNPKGVDALIQSYISCGQQFTPKGTAVFDSVTAYLKSAEDLDKKVAGLDDLVDQLILILNTDDVKNWLKETIELAVLPQDDAQLGATLDTIKQSKELGNLETELEKAAGLNLKSAMNNITQSAANLLNQMDTIDAFFQNISVYSTLFKCLNGIDKQKIQMANRTITIVQKIREIPTADIAEEEKVVAEIANAMTVDFKNLQNAIGSMESQVTDKSSVLKNLRDPKKHSDVLGTATRGISAMRSVIGKKDDANVIIKSERMVTAETANTAIPQNDKKILLKFAQLKTSLEAMYPMLEAWKAGVKVSDSPVLASHSDVFTSAAKVPGVPTNMAEIIKSLDQLASLTINQSAKPEIVALKHSLDSLAPLDLDFASHKASFDASKASLAVLDSFFASSRVDAGFSIPLWLYVVLGVLLLLAILVGAGIYTLHRHRSRKPKKEVEQPPVTKPPVKDVEPEAPKKRLRKYIPNFEEVHWEELDLDIAPGPVTKPVAFEAPSISEISVGANDEELAPTQRGNVYLTIDNRRYRMFISEIYRELVNIKFELITSKQRGDLDDGDVLVEYCAEKLRHKLPPPVLYRMKDIDKAHTRGSVQLLKNLRVKLRYRGNLFVNDFIHASRFLCWNGYQMIITQAPREEKRVKGKIVNYDTIQKFYYMVVQTCASAVMNLCQPSETECNEYFPKEEGQRLTFGEEIRVLCTKRRSDGDDLVIRDLMIRISETEIFTVKHYHYTKWSTALPPGNFDEVNSIMAYVILEETVVVHCSDGVERSNAFAHLHLCHQMIRREGVLDAKRALRVHSTMRADVTMKPLSLAMIYSTLISGCRENWMEERGQREEAILKAYHLARDKERRKLGLPENA